MRLFVVLVVVLLASPCRVAADEFDTMTVQFVDPGRPRPAEEVFVLVQAARARLVASLDDDLREKMRAYVRAGGKLRIIDLSSEQPLPPRFSLHEGDKQVTLDVLLDWFAIPDQHVRACQLAHELRRYELYRTGELPPRYFTDEIVGITAQDAEVLFRSELSAYEAGCTCADQRKIVRFNTVCDARRTGGRQGMAQELARGFVKVRGLRAYADLFDRLAGEGETR